MKSGCSSPISKTRRQLIIIFIFIFPLLHFTTSPLLRFPGLWVFHIFHLLAFLPSSTLSIDSPSNNEWSEWSDGPQQISSSLRHTNETTPEWIFPNDVERFEKLCWKNCQKNLPSELTTRQPAQVFFTQIWGNGKNPSHNYPFQKKKRIQQRTRTNTKTENLHYYLSVLPQRSERQRKTGSKMLTTKLQTNRQSDAVAVGSVRISWTCHSL